MFNATVWKEGGGWGWDDFTSTRANQIPTNAELAVSRPPHPKSTTEWINSSFCVSRFNAWDVSALSAGMWLCVCVVHFFCFVVCTSNTLPPSDYLFFFELTEYPWKSHVDRLTRYTGNYSIMSISSMILMSAHTPVHVAHLWGENRWEFIAGNIIIILK